VKKYNQHFDFLLEKHCWTGYHKVGTKMKGGKRVNNCVKNENTEGTDLKSIAKDFIGYTIKKLGIETAPKIILDKNKEMVLQLKAMGGYMPELHKIWVYTGNRNTADVLRTIGHELMHAKQRERSKDKPLDGTTGSPHENEANAMAGILLRAYGKMNPDIYN
jgi:Zn-dependent peptidase ImmA (M78 family)